MDSEIQAVRQTLIERRDAFQRAIDAFDVALGLGAIAPASAGAAKKPLRNERTNERTKQGARRPAARNLPDDEEVGPQENGRRQKIVTALADGALATREIAGLIKVDRKLTKMALQRMQKVGLVKGVGEGPARRWILAGSKPAKEVP